MTEQDYLLYSYTGNWNNNILPYTQRFPYSLIFHSPTKRIMNNGVIYGDGRLAENGPHFVKGLNASDDISGAWVGSLQGIDNYHEGLSIIFVPSSIGNSIQTTLEINGFGARNCYFTNSDPLTNQYSIGTPILLTYIGTANDGYWKRADMDTTKTPVVQADGTSSNYYLNVTSVTHGLIDVQTIGSNLRYEYSTQTLYCPNFNGNFTGNLTGLAQQASSLYPGRMLWGQLFDGSADIKGNIANTGNITPETDNSSNIGSALLYYNQAFAKYFRGRADGVRSYNYNNVNGVAKIVLLGQAEDVIDNNVSTGTGSTIRNQGLVYGKKTVYVTENGLLHSNYISAGNNSSYNPNYCFMAYDKSQFQKNVELTSGADLLIMNNGHIGIGVSSMSSSPYALRVNGDALFEGNNYGKVTANEFIKAGEANAEHKVLLADGTTKTWDVWDDLNDTHVGLKLVARDTNGNIYANRFFTNINEENINNIGSVYVTNGVNDTAIRKVSFSKFASILVDTNMVEITKNLKVTENWMDTGITTDSTTFPDGNGTYIMQVDATAVSNSTDLWASIYSGIITIYNGTNNTTEAEEVILHRSGHATAKRLYIRTIPTANTTGYCKIQIAASSAFIQNYNIKFKFKKTI